MRVKITRVTARPHTRLQARGLHSGQERADWQPLVGRRLLDGQGRQVRRGRTRCWPDRYGRHHRRARGGAISDARDRAESIGRALAEILTCGLGIHIGLVPLRVVLKGGGAFTRSGADGYRDPAVICMLESTSRQYAYTELYLTHTTHQSTTPSATARSHSHVTARDSAGARWVHVDGRAGRRWAPGEPATARVPKVAYTVRL